MNINPGELSKKIQIIKTEIKGQNKNGFPVKEETVIRTCYAKVTNTSGTELVKANTEFSQAKKRFLVRYSSKKIDTSMAVRYDGNDYNILYTNIYGDSKEYVEIWTEREVSSGYGEMHRTGV